MYTAFNPVYLIIWYHYKLLVVPVQASLRTGECCLPDPVHFSEIIIRRHDWIFINLNLISTSMCCKQDPKQVSAAS